MKKQENYGYGCKYCGGDGCPKCYTEAAQEEMGGMVHGMGMASVVERLNAKAVTIRRGGSVPYFYNEVVARVNGKKMTFNYEGTFEYAECVGDLVVIHYKGIATKFRVDQLSNMFVQ